LQVGAGHAQQLVADAGRALEVQATTVEETPDTIYLVLPSASPLGGGELSDRELAAVAGAGWDTHIVRMNTESTEGCPESQVVRRDRDAPRSVNEIPVEL
jgi:hypothetical protein